MKVCCDLKFQSQYYSINNAYNGIYYKFCKINICFRLKLLKYFNITITILQELSVCEIERVLMKYKVPKFELNATLLQNYLQRLSKME